MNQSDYQLLATSDDYRDVAGFWRDQLASVDAVPVVTSARPAPRQSLTVPIGSAARLALRRLSGDPLSRFTVAAAGLALAAARYFNTASTLLRSPLLLDGPESPHNPDREVALVFNVVGGATLRQFLEDAAAAVERSYEHQNYPVGMLCEQERGLTLGAQAVFSISYAAVHAAGFGPLAPLHFDCDRLDEGRLRIDFDPQAIEPFLVTGLAAMVPATLARFDDLSPRLDDVERLPPGQRQRLLTEWNRTDVARPFQSVVQLFEASAAAAPGAMALQAETPAGPTTLTYADLNRQANQLAQVLIASRGVETSGLIAIWMDRSPWLVVAVLGVLKAGLAYVPIDAATPLARVASILKDSGVGRVLIDGSKLSVAQTLECEMVVADREQAGDAANPGLRSGPADLAYVIYTSGSTGAPKGCAIEHHSLSNYLRWAIGYYWPSPGTGTMGLFTSLSFDLTVTSLFCPLLRGRTLVIYPQQASIEEVLRRQFEPGSPIDTIKLTPSHLRLLDPDRLQPGGMRLAIVGGEALTPQQVEVLTRIDPRLRVVNEYGPTEATVGCVVREIEPGAAVTIGRPIANLRIYVLDGQQRPVPIGVRGEICVAGDGVARGYHARTALTADRFVADPFTAGGRLYRTGDVGRWLPEGELECFGRFDTQVKLLGHRIELGEIERVLRRSIGVREAVVAVRDQAGEPGLVAYLVAAAPIVAADLRRELAASLPAFMVPAAFVRVDQMPLTANGKVDRARLLRDCPESRALYVEPRTAEQQTVARLWEALFHLEPIGLGDDFFALGGDSLRAMAMLGPIHRAFGVTLSVGEVLSHPTIEALTGVIAAKRPAAIPPLLAAPPADHHPVSSGQRSLWILSRIDAGSDAYHVSTAFELRGTLDRDALGRAFQAIVARHASLRTIFIEVDGEPRQQVQGEMALTIAGIDLRDGVDGAGRLELAVAAQAAAPFDLARGPLLRVGVGRIGESRHLLVITLHHIVSDEWSMRILITELIAFYDGCRTGVDLPIEPLAIQYVDYAEWQHQAMASAEMTAQRDYWVNRLSGDLAPLDLPGDFPRPAVQRYRGHHHRLAIDPALGSQLRAIGARHGASLFMVLLAAVKALMYRYSGQRDIRIGVPTAGRTREELTTQIGFFVNILVLRDEVLGSEPVGGLLDRVKRTAEEAYDHQLLPFDRLVAALDLPRDPGRSPLFDVMVAYESAPADGPSRGDLDVAEIRLESGAAKFDLTLVFAAAGDGLDVEIEYNTDLFAPDRIERLAAHLIQVLQAIAGDEATPIDGLPLWPAVERPVSDRAAIAVADRSSEVAPEPGRTAAPMPPRNARELLLVGVMESVLGRAVVGSDDNFFHIGGDSIKAIQVVTRLAREGWTLLVRDLFEAPRIDRLARRLMRAGVAPNRPRLPGDWTLTPIEQAFFATRQSTLNHYNQSVMLRFADGLDEPHLRQVGLAILQQHDALRRRFRVDAGQVIQFYAEPVDPVGVRDLRSSDDPVGDLERQAAAVQSSLDIEHGPTVRFELFRLPAGDRLLAVVHHLAIDGVSWRILFEDLRQGLGQLARGTRLDLGPASASFETWVAALGQLAGAAESERFWWDLVDSTPGREWPADFAPGITLAAEAREQRTSLGAEASAAMVSRVHQAYDTRSNDLLLTALARALRDWAGPGVVRVDLESHGRAGVGSLDVSRTVGWFTAIYPVLLDLGDEIEPGAQIEGIRDSLRRTPGHGLGHGLLRRGDATPSSIVFNFLGQFDTDLEGFEVADENRGAEQGPLATMSHELEVGGWIVQGRVHLNVRYSPQRFRDETIGRLLSAYRAALELLVAHCADREPRDRPAADFRYHDGWTAALVERLAERFTDHRVEDVYPLSPMQEGMLFHAVLASDSPIYCQQFVCSIAGPLDQMAFRGAWAQAIERHTVLRSAFFWDQVEQPLQVVFTHADPTWVDHDWRGGAPEALRSRLDAFLAIDRPGLPLDSPPLVQFTLIRTGDDAYTFCWRWHHILLDGWSTAIVLEEVFGSYRAATGGAVFKPAPARPFGEYIDWLGAQDPRPAIAYWREQLRGFRAPTPLPYGRASDRAPLPGENGAAPASIGRAEVTLSAASTGRLSAVAREHHLTLNTVARGAWALVLAAHGQRSDVVFGATVAGRPASLPGVDTMVGLFINTVPVRVRIDAGAPLVDWLHRLQAQQAELDQHAYCPLAEIQRLGEMPRRVALFDSILVFENYPIDQSIDPGLSGLTVDGIEVREQTNYPLTVAVVPGDQLRVSLSYDTSRLEAAAAAMILDEIEAMLGRFVAEPRQTVAALLLGGGDRQVTGRHDFLLDGTAGDDLRAVAIGARLAPAAVAQAIAALIARRYSAGEDLRCLVGGALVERGDGDGVGTLASLLTPAEAGDSGGRPADLRFEIREAAAGLTVSVVSDTGRFDEPFLRRIPSHLAAAIRSLAADPGQAIDRVDILPDAERARLVNDFNRTERRWGSERTIVEYIEAQAAAHPDRVAVVVPAIDRDDLPGDEQWTYGELNGRANQLARFLVAHHRIGPDVRVGVLAERSFNLVVALLAVEKAGGAYVPLEPEYPADRLQFMIEDSGAAAILTESRYRHLTGGYPGPVIALDTEWPRIDAETDGDLPSAVTGGSLAYVIYTSGSTGRPKGAMNTHRGIANRLLWMQEAYGLTADDRVLQKTPFSFDVSVWELFWPLMTGARLVVAKPGGHRDPGYLARVIEEARITTVHFVPSLLQAFIDEPGIVRCRDLRRVVCSGEALSPELLRRYRSRLDVPLSNLYGPTEAAVDVTAWRDNPAESTSMVPIGRPIANTQMYILDAHLEPVPEGVSGELFIGGDGVGRGYLNRPGLTREKFIPDPFRGGGATLYRTGDLARQRHDGTIDYLGRLDHQVKLRGFRIELGEIEAALLRHPEVREAVVVVREDQPGLRQLVAYVVTTGGVGAGELRAHLDLALPEYMVPAVFVLMAELPHLSNGKLDRRSLPVPPQVERGRRQVAPRDPTERRLIRLWAQVLATNRIGVTDDFFELGGHSILAVKLVSAIHSEFGRRLPLAQLLAHPTIERLAVALRAGGDGPDWRPLVEIARGGSAPPLFLVPGAGGNVMYFHGLAQHLAKARCVYGLQAVGLDGRTPVLTTVEAIAGVNLTEMRRVCPHGPYFLAAHSFGGQVALEMAQQLRRQGETVGLLAILDTVAPTFEPLVVGAGWDDAQWLARIAGEIELFFGVRLEITAGELAGLGIEAQLRLVAERLRRAGALAPDAGADDLRGYFRVYQANLQAGHVGYGVIAPVPIALFKALEPGPAGDEMPAGLIELSGRPGWGWERFAADRVTVADVPGGHLSMLAEPHVGMLAQALEAALQAAQVPPRVPAGTGA